MKESFSYQVVKWQLETIKKQIMSCDDVISNIYNIDDSLSNNDSSMMFGIMLESYIDAKKTTLAKQKKHTHKVFWNVCDKRIEKHKKGWALL